MKWIIGLGNPGIRYQKTRHNIGRRLVEFLAERAQAGFVRKKDLAAMAAVGTWGEEQVTLVYPEVFMNVSGQTLAKIKDRFPVHLQSDLLVVIDDAALPFGMLRLRPQGSSGGHNGLKSAAEALGSDEFARLRLGIGYPGNTAASAEAGQPAELHDYVLEPFSAAEEKQMPALLARAEEACRLWAGGPIERAMNFANPRTAGS